MEMWLLVLVLFTGPQEKFEDFGPKFYEMAYFSSEKACEAASVFMTLRMANDPSVDTEKLDFDFFCVLEDGVGI